MTLVRDLVGRRVRLLFDFTTHTGRWQVGDELIVDGIHQGELQLRLPGTARQVAGILRSWVMVLD